MLRRTGLMLASLCTVRNLFDCGTLGSAHSAEKRGARSGQPAEINSKAFAQVRREWTHTGEPTGRAQGVELAPHWTSN
jgi:hypothetical protein